MNRQLFSLVFVIILLLLDVYIFQLIKTLTLSSSETTRRTIHFIYWGVNFLTLGGIIVYNFFPADQIPYTFRQFLLTWAFMLYISKIFGALFLIIDDVIRLFTWIYHKINPSSISDVIGTTAQSSEEIKEGADKIPRSEFLMKAGVVAMATPLVTLSWGIVSGAHDYTVRKKTIVLPNLPKAFDGIKMVQISDVHSGSFFNKKAVEGGIDLIMKQKPDVIFFTGDLVNNMATEMKDYQDIFSRLKAPMGVYSVLGNHDYGDYVRWESPAAKRKNLEDLKQTHGRMGWKLLMNENHFLETNNEKIAIIGIENWGAKGNFARHGDLEKAYQGTQDAPVKILLSHDPSHWDAQVNGSKSNLYTESFDKAGIKKRAFNDIDLTLAGHTHGMQFGIDTEVFKWSPVKYMYEQWADLYKHENQYLYVNRGFGYLGYPGRIGILPEITVLELKSA
ncbi:metallophosphoesterase [Bernardetia sp. ABR2-2B]|uniref:metallophosphoesterase n=1 Tax=Bernardetia sp. ABR2-2B TaxID=3127472 RepID=UPI0030CC3311